MTNDIEVATLEEIERDECVQLLATTEIGRLAVAVAVGPPLIVPVNYLLDGDVIVFRSDPGEKLLALQEHPVSFQVDVFDPYHRTGWSVLVRGVARITTEPEVEHLDLAPWVGARVHWVRLVPGSITGRRIRVSEARLDSRGYL